MILPNAKDGGTYLIAATFKDENGSAVTPNAITWSLFGANENYINSRSAVSIGSPATAIDILLTGNDLNYSDGAVRHIVILADYDSDAGTGLSMREQESFRIVNITGV